ncbi:uncharacterized protein LOC123556816 [Mercenaria mercenaria]|uniref:uncharacterized protein LOC123556816 n=1 Tax=Mercenaria mercenaria TaxID=6596 RepID=UPI00234F3324|nr:uncharacterized protein LOC123556816 [Mercenaria mercenaria]
MGGKNSKRKLHAHHKHQHIQHLVPFLDVEVNIDRDDRCSFSGITCMNGGKIVVADYLGHHVKYYDWKMLKLLDYVDTTTPPYEVCSSAVNETDVFVTLPFESKIYHFQLKENKLVLLKEIPTEGMCYGIGSFVDGLAVSLRIDKHIWQIEILDYQGSVQKVFKDDDDGKELFGFADYITVDTQGQRLIVSDGLKGVVVCFDLKHSTMTSIKEIYRYMCSHLQIPKGLSLDNLGNLFIVGCESSNVHKVSCDGERIGVVLGKKDQLENPMGIVYDSSENKVFVTEGSRRVMIFKDRSTNS